MNRQVRDRQTGMRLTERTRKLFPDKKNEAYRKERSVICNDDDVGGRARITRDEERGGRTEMRWWRYGGCVVVRIL